MSRIDTLMRDMTLVEKLGQLTMAAADSTLTGPTVVADSTDAIRSGAIGSLFNLIGVERVRALQRVAVEQSRLGIPLLFALDVLHGYRTLFPVGLAEASLFDPQSWALTAREAAKEASREGIDMVFAPMLDVSRDPRWGRSVEGPGEDPWVAARIAEAKVRGFQGADLAAADALAAVAKHYCAYGSVTAGREYASVDISERTLLEVHMPAFAAAIAAGVVAVMPCFVDLAGTPMTANVHLLRHWLRGRLGFDGVIVSDYNSIGELIQHGVAADLPEAAALALTAGVDIDMVADAYRLGLPGALQRGLVSMALIDEAVRRVLILKERLGLFEDPYRRCAAPEPATALTNRRQIARAVAGRAVLMLTNHADTLPLPAGRRRLALIGPLADASAQMRGPWWAAASAQGHVSVLEGFRTALAEGEVLQGEVLHAAGVHIEAADLSGIPAALELCERADAILLCVGEAAAMSGEAASRAHLDLPGQQRVLAEAVLARAKTLGKRVIVILFSGRPLVIPWLIEQADAVLAAWFLGSEAGNAIADAVTGRISPSARTPVSWARAVGQVPIFFSQRPSGRPTDPANHYSSKYLDESTTPLFPFGHGLSYGRFTASNLQVTPRLVRPEDTIQARVDVRNDGPRRAEETVFLFAHDVLGSVARPTLELKGWAKVELAPGERATISLQLAAADLRFLGKELEPVFEAGEVEILVGPCADRSRLLIERIHLSD